MNKEDKNPKEERKKKKEEGREKKEERRRKTRPEVCLEQEPAETVSERNTTISQNRRMSLQTKPKKNKPDIIRNKDVTRESTKDLNRAIFPFVTAICKSTYSEVEDQCNGQMRLHVQVEITHYDEMNDKIFNI
jgi:hypothetical protein